MAGQIITFPEDLVGRRRLLRELESRLRDIKETKENTAEVQSLKSFIKELKSLISKHNDHIVNTHPVCNQN
jgi:hypothetical protein